MAQKMETQIDVINTAFNEVDMEKRIFYLQSENRNILEKAVNESVDLWLRLREIGTETAMCDEVLKKLKKKDPEYKPIQRLKEKKRIRDWTASQPMTESEGDALPVCWYIRDFQVYSKNAGSNEADMLIKGYLDDPRTVHSILLISSPIAYLPMGLEEEIELIKVKPINQIEIQSIVESFFKSKSTALNDDDLERISKELLGFSEKQLRILLKKVYADMESEDVQQLDVLKKEVKAQRKINAEKDGTLVFDEEKAEATGMARYQDWLGKRKKYYTGGEEACKAYGIPPIKGILVTGVPGTGKTAMARKTAEILGNIPLVKFNLASLQNSEFGRSEANLIRYLDRLDAIGQCVILIDEIEKSFNKENMHEVKRQQLGILLDWMQRNKKVFCFFTSNDVQNLPDELMRDGRVNERFFAFMPTASEICEILHLHMRKLNTDSGNTLYAEDLVQAIAAGEDSFGQQVMAEVLKRARNKDLNPEAVGKLSPFLTGANIVKLLEITNIAMEEKNKKYTVQDYKEELIETLCSRQFIPYGESNPVQIARQWIFVRKNQYMCVSKQLLLEPSEKDFDMQKGEFTEEYKNQIAKTMESYRKKDPEGTNIASLDAQYANWFAYRFCPVIEEEWKKVQGSY